jgi:hypothetical protein
MEMIWDRDSMLVLVLVLLLLLLSPLWMKRRVLVSFVGLPLQHTLGVMRSTPYSVS